VVAIKEAFMKKIICSFVILAAIAACGGGTPQSPAPRAPSTPGYEGVVLTEWLRDGRTMKLLEDFAYVDAAGKRWLAKKGLSVDGASIPRALWWSGGPYEGTYREASVVHDVYCAENPKTASWQAVHRMFYEAMLTSGVEQTRALVMYGAVYRHGPRWPNPPGIPAPAGAPPARPTKPLEDDVKDVESLVNSGKVNSPEEVEALPPTIVPPPK
jgi:hypothetical protein